MKTTGTLALAALLLGVPLVTHAQSAPTGSLTGRIVAAASGQPVVDAVVALDGTARQARSNSFGRFLLDSLAPGIYTVRARAIGYAPSVRTDVVVSSGRPGELRVTLQERLVELEELEVTALSYFPPAADQPAST